MTTSEYFTSIWELYGLKFNPFSTDPLLLDGGIISLDTFTGRDVELRRIKQIFRSGGGSRIIVSGEQGVGKTTFVNYARHIATQENFFTPAKEIAVQSDWSANDFLINTLAAITTTLNRKKNMKFPENTKKTLNTLFEMIELRNLSGSISILGSGAGAGKSSSIHKPNLNTYYLKDLFEKVIEGLFKSGYSAIILHYNNLELMEQETLIKLFNSIRDFLQQPNTHFVFVGNMSVPSALESVKRVSSIFSDTPIYIKEFTFEEIKQIIAKRIKELKIKDYSVQEIYEEEVINALYDLYGGNIRAILNSLSTAIMELVEEKPITLSVQRLKQVLLSVVQERYLNNIAGNDKKVLLTILKKKEATNKEIAKLLNKKPQNVSKNTKNLLGINAIYFKTAGTEKYFSVAPPITWLNLKDIKILKKEPEQKRYSTIAQKLLKDWSG